MTNCVVVVKTKQGDEILAILNGEINGVIKVEHPFYIRYNPMTNNIGMTPYCALTDEKYFEFRRENLEFLVTASREIAQKFLRLVETQEALVSHQSHPADDDEFDIHSYLGDKTVIPGGSTKH